MGIKDRVKLLRQQYGFCITTASDLLNTSKSTIFRWESGECMPNSENIQMLAELYGVSADWILTGESAESGTVSSCELASVGERLRKLRECKDLSMKQFALLMKTHKKNVYWWEHDRFEPGAASLVRIAEFYGVSADWILYGVRDSQ